MVFTHILVGDNTNQRGVLVGDNTNQRGNRPYASVAGEEYLQRLLHLHKRQNQLRYGSCAEMIPWKP